MADSVVVSDEIPVGSPPAPPGRHAAPGGWYPDPVDLSRERYWDGWQWSRQTREASAKSGTASRAAQPTGASGAARPGVPGDEQPASMGVVGHPAPAGPGALAGWWHRALAAVLDGVLLFLVTSAVLSPLYLRIADRMQPVMEEMFAQALRGETVSPLRPEQLMSQQDQIIIVLVMLVIALGYHIGMLRWRGATVGKLITGLRAVPVERPDQLAEPSDAGLPWRTAVLRGMMWVIPGQHSCLWVIRVVDVIMPLTNPQRQALHDRIAATQVVKTR